MYVSPAVKSISRRPIEGASVTVLLRVADGTDVDTVGDAVREVGGTVESELQFRTLMVSVAHEDLPAVCAIDGIESIETKNTLAIDADGAGEDVEQHRFPEN
ncbi:hypothetical protein [Halorhabdus amylolytica]|uniref:hypothetical protein n=1 Tax=Halorhabdus amylolytica TaxID=2559573 RepID=UPI0010AAA8A1|nr:hypothetical protein [Halorhabdus amylolytica]